MERRASRLSNDQLPQGTVLVCWGSLFHREIGVKHFERMKGARSTENWPITCAWQRVHYMLPSHARWQPEHGYCTGVDRPCDMLDHRRVQSGGQAQR
jgi:hypothetical protein